MDIASGLEGRQRLTSASAPVTETGILVSDPDVDSFVLVNSSGKAEKVRVPLGMQLGNGDTVLLLRGGKRCWIVSKLFASHQLPNEAIVTTVTGGSNTITVTYNTYHTLTLPFLASYVPNLGDTVRITWEPNGGGYISGKLGTVPLPPPPPPTLSPSAPPAPVAPPVVTNGQSNFGAQDAVSFRNGKWRSDSGNVVQSDWGGYGENYGAWFYGSTPKDTLNGATITRLQITIGRKSGGVYGPQTVHFYLHGSFNRPGGNVDYYSGNWDKDINIGEYAWFDLPVDWGQSIVNNGGGIAIKGAPYVVLHGINGMSESGLLKMDWSI